jgi:predicted aspartyl protease
LDNQSKVVAAEEQTAAECKKSKEKYVADIKSIKDKIGNIENLLAVLIPR